MTFIGERVQRLEDGPLVTGQGRYVANVSFPNELHMRVVRAGYAHGELNAIDASSALALPGVVAVWTAIDVQDIPPIEFLPTRVQGLEPYRQPILASRLVRYVGEPTAPAIAEYLFVGGTVAHLEAASGVLMVARTVAEHPADNRHLTRIPHIV